MKKWIQAAHLKKGAFTAKAMRAGMSVQAYADKVLKDKKADPTTKRQALLAKYFKKHAKKT